MSKSSRRRNLAEVATLVARCARLLPRLERLLDDETVGEIMRTADGGGGGRGNTSDRTASVATHPSKARADEREMDRHLLAAARAMLAAERIVTHYTTGIPLKAEELAKLERDADPGCEILAKVGAWEPTYRQATTVGGRLPRAYRLGRWTYDFVGKTDRLPNEGESRAHADGRRVLVSA